MTVIVGVKVGVGVGVRVGVRVGVGGGVGVIEQSEQSGVLETKIPPKFAGSPALEVSEPVQSTSL